MRYQLPRHVHRSSVDSRAVLLDTRRDRFYVLNTTAARIAALLVGGSSTDVVATDIARHYGIEPLRAQRDVDRLISGLLQRGLIESA